MPDPAVRVEGNRELAAAFRRAAGTTKDLKRAHQKVSKTVESGTKRTSMNRQQERAKRALLGRGSQREATLRVRNMASAPFGIGAFLGAKGRFGWYSAGRYRGSGARQFPDWVSDNWNLWEGRGPYVIAEAIERDQDLILEAFADSMAQAMREAGLVADF